MAQGEDMVVAFFLFSSSSLARPVSSSFAGGGLLDATRLGKTFGASHPAAAVPGRHAPGLGEHNREILNALGYDNARIEELRELGVIDIV